jgi:hypothetical protein
MRMYVSKGSVGEHNVVFRRTLSVTIELSRDVMQCLSVPISHPTSHGGSSPSRHCTITTTPKPIANCNRYLDRNERRPVYGDGVHPCGVGKSNNNVLVLDNDAKCG